MNPITKKIYIQHGFCSLVGICGHPPYSWGNYHSLIVNNKEYRVANMWFENLTAAKSFLQDDQVEVRMYSNFLLIDDDRIPDNYYYDPLHLKYMETNLDEVKDAYEYWGDPDNEIEQFTNPKNYYEKRGSSYNEKTGIITTQIKTQDNKSLNFKGNSVLGEGYFYLPGK